MLARHFRILRPLTLLLAGWAAGCASTTSLETLDGKLNELQRQVMHVQTQGASKDDVAAVGAALQTQAQATLKAQADLQLEIQALVARMGELEAKLESTNLRLTEVSQQLAAAAQEMRARATPVAEGANVAVEDPKALYEAAYNDYLRGNYETALQGFQAYLTTFPGTDLADNAVYWMGECQYRQKRFRPAIQEFDTVIQRYTRSDKLASAWLKKGYAHLELGERQQGIVNLRFVVREFPAGDEANLARQKLRELGVDVR